MDTYDIALGALGAMAALVRSHGGSVGFEMIDDAGNDVVTRLQFNEAGDFVIEWPDGTTTTLFTDGERQAADRLLTWKVVRS